jgi:hypothetical protein
MILNELWSKQSISDLPLLSKQITIPLYHISFDGELAGIWTPRNPDGYTDRTSSLSEPDLPRISVAPTIVQCFQAIYPNVCKYFEDDDYPNLEFHVYKPKFKGHERILSPQYLTKSHMVHDAHMTHEYCILDDTTMQKVGKVTIQNTNRSPFLDYYPFNQSTYDLKSFAPAQICFDWIK